MWLQVGIKTALGFTPMSQVPNSCLKDQKPLFQPVLPNSTAIGLNVRIYEVQTTSSGIVFRYKINTQKARVA